jgi:hypothetical protein
MKKLTSILFAVTWVMILCTGCIPYHFTTRPGATGVVLDAGTHAPVVGAIVSVIPGRGDGSKGVATTATDGSFRVPPRRQWGVYIVPGDVFPFPFELSVQRDGYQQVEVKFAHRAMGEGKIRNFGQIQMEDVAR